MQQCYRPNPLLLAVVLLGVPLGTTFGADISGSVEAGSGYLNRDAGRFRNFSGVNDQGFTPFLDFAVQSKPAPASGETCYWRFEGEHLGLAIGRLTAEIGDQGRERLRLQWRSIPTFQFNDARTPVRGAGTVALSLPSSWQASGQTTAGMSTLQENLIDLSLEQKRHSFRLDYRRLLHPAWNVDGEVRREHVSGTRALGAVTGATGGNSRAALLPAPIDYETYTAALGLGFSSRALRLRLGYQGSFFSNAASSLFWPTLYGQHPQWAPGIGFPDGRNQLALEPDNQAHALSLGGSLVLSPSQRLHVDAALGRQRQNQAFMPYTINPTLLQGAALPLTSLDGRIGTARLDLRLSSRPSPGLNLVTRLNYRDRDNRTPIAAFQRVRGDAVVQQDFNDARLNRPYSLSEAKAGVDASYRLGRRLRLESGLEHVRTERTYSETRDMSENILRLGLRGNASDTLALAAEYRHQRRRTDDYVNNRPLVATHVPGTIEAEDFENHPLLRKYYLSARDRDQARLHANWQALSVVSVGAALAFSRDEYPDGFFGLNSSILRSATLDFSYAPGQNLRLSGFYNHDRYENEQSGRAFRGNVPADVQNPARNWFVTASDRFNTLGLGFGREQLPIHFGSTQVPGLLDLNLDLSHSRSSGDFVNSTGPALNSAPLPALATRLDNLTLSARYTWNARSSVRLALIREHYRSEDFALDGVTPATVASVLLLGQASPHYQATWTTLSYRYDF